ncbi:hypothetical protein GUJ93_ZPchr0001g32784 [Zizania palustris]|uniref:Uncharacterized protein n=1 Tax=Zizania palustris TaxID=103762 RepID=A0A8J5RMD8_ZIZPA|nr:hypothetical protein GUJ93_ZPchr0001g32784 [Zizania palustris]
MVGGGGSGGGAEAGIMSPAAGGGKRGRGAEEDVYVDNLHSHKRYLSEIMASSLNGLSVGDSVSKNIMMSPVGLESASSFRDEIISQYSPMSEDSDDYRYYDTQVNGNGSQTELMYVLMLGVAPNLKADHAVDFAEEHSSEYGMTDAKFDHENALWVASK